MDHADEPVVYGDGSPRVTRLSAHLADDRAGVLAGSPDNAARRPGGPAQLARDVPGHRVGAEAVDLEAVDIVQWPDLGRVELDHRVVERVVARHHGAEHPGGFHSLGADLRAGAAAVCGGEPSHVAAV